MAIWVWKQHDTWPPAFATLEDSAGVPIPDLDKATSIKIVARPKTGKDPESPLFKVAVKLVDVSLARVEYVPIAAHTETTQELSVEFEIDWGGGKIQTVPSEGYGIINIVDDLG